VKVRSVLRRIVVALVPVSLCGGIAVGVVADRRAENNARALCGRILVGTSMAEAALAARDQGTLRSIGPDRISVTYLSITSIYHCVVLGTDRKVAKVQYLDWLY
jgi:hypothetical protein